MKPLLLSAVLAGSVVAALAVPAAAVAQPSHTVQAVSTRTVSATSLLASLRVAAPDSSHRYQRARFGYDVGFDADGDGCETRKEVLIRDHLGAISVSASCSVRSTWRSLYDGRVTSVAANLEIDHLVPLAEAWHAGAWKWSHERQIAFGNDVDYRWDLQAVTASLNQDKGDKDPAKWLPSKNRCTYAEAWVGVKARWNLSVDRAEKAELTRLLATCGTARVLKPSTPNVARLATTHTVAVVTPAPVVPVVPVVPVATPVPSVPVIEPTATSSPVVAPLPTSAPAVYYANCTAVRAAGAAPLLAGQPGYRSALDRDGDGVACET